MPLSWSEFKRALTDHPLPAAVIDLAAFERNIDRTLRRLQDAPSDLTIRVASKSLRHTGLIRRALARGGERIQGLMCFSLREMIYLLDEGFDDLLLAYPSVQKSSLTTLAHRAKGGATVRLMADSVAHLYAYAEVARSAGTCFDVVVDADMAFQPATGLHVGVLRSPLRDATAVRRLAESARRMEGVRIVGLMGYEAHIAGLPDNNPFSKSTNAARRLLRRLSVPAVAKTRKRAVEALRAAGAEVALVNGGGTGSLSSTIEDPSVTEVTVGSGFVCSHLFDYYRDNDFEPAAFFAVEVSRAPDEAHLTLNGGGYVASGEPGWDRLPVIHLPPELAYVKMEGAGEVQTPVKLPRSRSGHPNVGDPVIFRHAKAGELAERFTTYLLVREGVVEAEEPTYRGAGHAFG